MVETVRFAWETLINFLFNGRHWVQCAIALRDTRYLPNDQDEVRTVDVFSAETLISGVNPEAAQVALAAAFLNKEKARFREHPQPVATLDPI